MPKVKISDFNSNPALNTDIDSINLAEGCAPSGINDAIRELMSQLKDWQAGTSNDPMVIGSTGSLTLNQGTANGVAYLNGSKIVTSGSALTFDGTNLGVTGNTSTTVQASSRNDNGTTNAGAKLATLYTSTEITSLGHYWDGSQFLGKVNFLSDLLFTRNNSEQMRLTSTGLGIGTSSPAYKLDVYGTGSQTVAVRSATSGDVRFYAECAGTNSGWMQYTRSLQALQWSANGSTQHLTLDSSGNLGLGVTPKAWRSGASAFQSGGYLAAWTQANGSVNLSFAAYEGSGNVFNYSTTGDSPTMYSQLSGAHKWYNATSGTAGNAITFTQAMTLDASGNLLVGTTSSDGSRLRVYGSYQTLGDGAYEGLIGKASSLVSGGGSGDFAIRSAANLVFSTNGNTERARIDSSGNLLVGTTTSSFSNTNGFIYSNGTQSIEHISGTGSGTGYSFFVYNGSLIGSITQSGTTAVLYNVTSDQRLKENIVDAPEFGSVIDSIKVRSYDWKTDGTHQRAGFVAQELVTVAPEAVHQPEDSEQMMAVDYSKLVPMLVKEVQSLRARVAQLEAN